MIGYEVRKVTVIKMAIVYYDGDCGYCNRAVKWLINRKISRTFQFAQLEGVYGMNLVEVMPQLKTIDSIVVVDKEDVFIKSDAIIHLLSQFKRYKWLAILLSIIPKFVRDVGYELFTKIRYKIPFKESCRLPSKYERQYFLD
ncbi:thiol-disulfide oxidoreductase [Mammaliicoccus stepanovicii]|uniref:Thiol-disulfide oxidoreductase n=2 Tax=Mammaliicoccus stepanovicii TaxID=643214 RepID=A0A239YMA1_9STAP|nr:thiol-disulfide oxidoreductase [Mammaliicoccus stepanovicii]